jgi:glyoxylase-like metal-dependent hydrolase (beta-lactamase superfamily II)
MAWTNLGLEKWRFAKGLHEVGGGSYAWLQPDGSWGWSNAGLIVDGDQSLLVDTLFDVPLTQTMLDAMKDAEPGAAAHIDTVVNTHANGDHCHGNQLVEDAEIITSAATAREMSELPPSTLAQLQKSFADDPSRLGRFVRKAFGPFQFEGIRHVEPTRTFEKELSVSVGDKAVELIEVGPAHTKGDVLVHVPADRVVYTGDILFVEGTPIVWAGPFSNWIRACEMLAEMDVDAIVPGHGPITDRRGADAVKAYLEFVYKEAHERFEGGLSATEAARDIELGEFADWSDSERIAVNVDTVYRELGAREVAQGTVDLLGLMAELADLD